MSNSILLKWYTWVVIVLCFSLNAQQQGVRIKDVAAIEGVEDLQIFGYGLVVGLSGSGDRSQTIFTEQTIKNMLKNMGVELPEKHMRMRNVAAVMVTGTLTPFKSQGSRFDVTVSSMGDARSLEGGTLILTPLQGADGEIYATAQGALATGGFKRTNKGLSSYRKNHVMVGRIPDGAIVQNEYKMNTLDEGDLAISLNQPDFTSAVKMAEAVNDNFSDLIDEIDVAVPEDPSTVVLNYAEIKGEMNGLMSFVSRVENIRFDRASQAKVVVNERTGTIVAGGDVRISDVAVTHGGVKVEIVNRQQPVQPPPFTLGQPGVIPEPEMATEEKDMDMVVLNATTTVIDLAQALNSLGVVPRDVITILQAIKDAGALHGKLRIM
ncbi:MAG: flagellar basal body P-ring protein FlgI [Chitinivibrionales bacterium]